ncbi:MAG: putative glycoside hydrolase, partial [Patescibacteria group bacterium]
IPAAKSAPLLANYYLRWDISESAVGELSKWDLLILDMEVQQLYSTRLKEIRKLNPDIIILAYVTAQEIRNDALYGASQLRRWLGAGIDDSWYLVKSNGQRYSYWPDTTMLNPTDSSPIANGQRWNSYLANFIAKEILATGLWDGVFYDNMWAGLTWFTGADVDLNRDGRADSGADEHWRRGMRELIDETRRLVGNKYFITGNSNSREYTGLVNGKMLENFIPGDPWAPSMNTYRYNNKNAVEKRINIINTNTANKGGETNYKLLRFGLGSALLEDGYFSFDYGDQDHGQLWRYDEYDVGLGKAISQSKSQQGFSDYEPDVWQRDFENGLSLVNSTNRKQQVQLGGEYEKIHGVQDTTVNDGSIVSDVSLDPDDGLILLKTFQTLDDLLFINGAFLRFFRPDGERARNGFFVFDEANLGGKKIAKIDLNGNGKRELVVVSQNKIMVWRDDGLLYMRVWPYTANYKGDLRVAIGDINADGRGEIYVAPSPGYTLPIKVYSRHGAYYNGEWYPFGRGYKGGYSLAVREAAGRPSENELVIGTGEGALPMVSLFNREYQLNRQWLAFESSFIGGLNVAAGDVNGDGIDEVIVGAGPGKKPVIRIFDPFGAQMYQEFAAYSALDYPGIQVMASDVDYDGKEDIIGMSAT